MHLQKYQNYGDRDPNNCKFLSCNNNFGSLMSTLYGMLSDDKMSISLENALPKAGDCASLLMADSFLPDDLRFCNETSISTITHVRQTEEWCRTALPVSSEVTIRS